MPQVSLHRLYADFKALGLSNYYDIVRFYERNVYNIRLLEFEAYFDCTTAYTLALYEIAHYSKYILQCDRLLELVMEYNIDFWEGRDVYAMLLYKKAGALYYLNDLPAAEHVSRELVKIYPANRHYVRLLKACLLKQKPRFLKRAYSSSLFLILLSVLFFIADLIVLQLLYPAYYQLGQQISFGTLVAGVAILFTGESVHSVHCYRDSAGFARSRKRKMRQQSAV